MFIFWSFSRPIVAMLRFPTVKSLLSTYRYFFKRFLASLCEGNSKDCEFCCFFQDVDSVLFYILSEYLFFDLSLSVSKSRGSRVESKSRESRVKVESRE
jgi:hypothetical protein